MCPGRIRWMEGRLGSVGWIGWMIGLLCNGPTGSGEVRPWVCHVRMFNCVRSGGSDMAADSKLDSRTRIREIGLCDWEYQTERPRKIRSRGGRGRPDERKTR